MKQIEVNDAFLYDLHQLAVSAEKLHNNLRDLRVIVRSADERWAKSNVGNKEAAKRQERKPYIDDIKRILRDLNTCLYSIDDTVETWDIDIYEHVHQWTKEASV